MKALEDLFCTVPVKQISNSDKIVIFSDLHLGNRKARDDFRHNSEMFMYALLNYYNKNDYFLVLNGDIEELQRVSFRKIYSKWRDLYQIFSLFNQNGRLLKTIGNHDIKLRKMKLPEKYPLLYDGIKFVYQDNDILVFHGHQVSSYRDFRNTLIEILLKTALHPLGIKNFTRSLDNSKKHKIEQCVYDFSVNKKIISIIGHTHRPLFESLSDGEMLKFSIERLISEYINTADEEIRKSLQSQINFLKKKLDETENPEYPAINSTLYNTKLTIPCIFNSGYAIGNRGFTGIEIENGEISLIHWFGEKSGSKFFNYSSDKENLVFRNKTRIYNRTVLKKDTLNSTFTRIRLLG
ncbi:MAG: metallophosphoesterase [Spirochaetes bacterium]|nr:metallophosphoesterase [Spirochaetota bacterium]